MMAISHASMILNWYENLPSKDMPPKWMWTLTEELDEHFEMLRDERSDGSDRSSGPMMRNEYARDRGPNAR